MGENALKMEWETGGDKGEGRRRVEKVERGGRG